MRDYTRTAERYFCQLPGVRSDIRQTDLLDSDKISWFRAADAVLLPFRAPEAVEPALSLLEAMACGAVTVATPAANRSGLIRHGTTGLLYDGPEQLAATLADVLDQRIGPAIGEHARLTVLERHSLATVAAAAQQLWLHLEERSRRKRDWRS
jgi:glycosyltransferase involved in cell wall biosynthesis